MVYSLTWLPEVLEAEGLKVSEVDGWRTRGRAEMGTVRGVICHHTATRNPKHLNMPTLWMLRDGRSDLAGPLSQLGLGRDGTVYVIAAGRANHAGNGSWEGFTNSGNSNFIGIEAENDGSEPWPDIQMDAYRRTVAAILNKIKARENMCCGHKEWAPRRKPDPSFDMAKFRADVRDLLDGKSRRDPTPAVSPDGHPTLMRGAKGDEVRALQKAIGVAVDGDFGANTEAALRVYQRKAGLNADGRAGPKTWATIANGGVVPDEYKTPPPIPALPPPAAMPSPAPIPAAPAAASAGAIPPPDTAAQPARMVDGKAIGPDGTKFAIVHKLGFYDLGHTRVGDWIAKRPAPPKLSPSLIAVLEATSANEGRFEAINSYDNSFLSFGILQWTAGSGDGDGELAALLARLKQDDEAAFADCFGRFGLDVRLAQPGALHGKLSIDGKLLAKAADKEPLRGVAWAYRFWRAGHHDAVRLAQIEWAGARIGQFIDKPTKGRPLHEWITSERGIAHLFDEHINRPGHVPGTLERGIADLGANDPSGWDTAQEGALIDAYLKERHARPERSARGGIERMTHSVERAEAIDALVAAGKLSRERGSFHFAGAAA